MRVERKLLRGEVVHFRSRLIFRFPVRGRIAGPNANSCEHGFQNLHSEPAKALAVVKPAQIGPDFFREMAALVNAGGPPEVGKLKEIRLRHGLVPAPM